VSVIGPDRQAAAWRRWLDLNRDGNPLDDIAGLAGRVLR
jgi:hypothetical protein